MGYRFGMFEYNIYWQRDYAEIKTPLFERTWVISFDDDSYPPTAYWLWIKEGKGKIDEQDIQDGDLLRGRITYKTDRNTILAKCLTFINNYEFDEEQADDRSD